MTSESSGVTWIGGDYSGGQGSAFDRVTVEKHDDEMMLLQARRVDSRGRGTISAFICPKDVAAEVARVLTRVKAKPSEAYPEPKQAVDGVSKREQSVAAPWAKTKAESIRPNVSPTAKTEPAPAAKTPDVHVETAIHGYVSGYRASPPDVQAKNPATTIVDDIARRRCRGVFLRDGAVPAPSIVPGTRDVTQDVSRLSREAEATGVLVIALLKAADGLSVQVTKLLEANEKLLAKTGHKP